MEDLIAFLYSLLSFGAIFILALAISGNRLLPVWMFINSISLITHVTLIPSNISGHAHVFLTKHLDIIRMNFGVLDTRQSQQLDAQLVLSKDEASLYTTVIHACGYSLSLWQNMFAIFILLGLVLLAWTLVAISDRLANVYNWYKKKYEPLMNNFTVRFLYEVFFEVILCVIISLTFREQHGEHRLTLSFIVSIILILFLGLSLAFLTVLPFKRRGPNLARFYEKCSF